MKNRFIIIIFVFLIIFFASSYVVYDYRKNAIASQEINESYKSYYDKEIYGTELISIINKTIDLNEKNGILKDEKDLYIQNDYNSVKVYIKFKYENDYQMIEMERISNKGTENFRKNYGSIKFKCTEIVYHNKTNNINELTFTEI